MRTTDQSLQQAIFEFKELYNRICHLPTNSLTEFRHGLKDFLNRGNFLLQSLAQVAPASCYHLKAKLQSVELIYRFTESPSDQWTQADLEDIRKKLLRYHHEISSDPQLAKSIRMASRAATLMHGQAGQFQGISK